MDDTPGAGPSAGGVAGRWRRWAGRVHRFRPRLIDDLKGYDRHRFAGDCFAGVTVGVVALPLAMAFAIASGVKPEHGVVTAVIAGFLVAALGGSPVQIAGPAGAFIVVVYGIAQRYGFANLMVATFLAGVLLLLLGWLRLGVLVRYIPVSIVVGFTNGIAVLIALSQLKDLLGLRTGPVAADFFSQVTALWRHAPSTDAQSVALGTAAFAGLVLWGRLAALPTAVAGTAAPPVRLPRAGRAMVIAARVPGPIVAVTSLSLLAAALQWPVETIGSRFGGIPRALPAFAWPALDWLAVQQLFVPTMTIALLGAVESLLCARIADGMTSRRRHDPDQELMAQGIANIVVPLFGGIPATGTIARTVTNARAGATSGIAGIVHAATLLTIILVAAPLAAAVPLPVLAGVVLFVAWNMADWGALSRLGAFPVEHRAKLIGTFALTVLVDLTVAMEVGLAVACVVFVWRMATLFRVEAEGPGDAAPPPGVAVFRMRGALFFAAVGQVESLPDRLPPGTRTVVLDARPMLSIDASGIAALADLHGALGRAGLGLVVFGAEPAVLAALARAGLTEALGPGHVCEDRDQALRAAVPAARGSAPASS